MMVKVPVGAKPGQLLQMQTPDGHLGHLGSLGRMGQGMGPDGGSGVEDFSSLFWGGEFAI